MKRWCVECNNEVSLLGQYCSKCGGKKFQDNWPRCSKCNMIYNDNGNDKFCTRYGSDLRVLARKACLKKMEPTKRKGWFNWLKRAWF
jgi:hypothetical protein